MLKPTHRVTNEKQQLNISADMRTLMAVTQDTHTSWVCWCFSIPCTAVLFGIDLKEGVGFHTWSYLTVIKQSKLCICCVFTVQMSAAAGYVHDSNVVWEAVPRISSAAAGSGAQRGRWVHASAWPLRPVDQGVVCCWFWRASWRCASIPVRSVETTIRLLS